MSINSVASIVTSEAKRLNIAGLTATQAGTFGASHNASETASAVYAYAYQQGIRPTDLERPKNKTSTGTEESYAGWQAVARAKVLTKADLAFMDTPAPARDNKTMAADAARDKRKALSDKVSNALKTYRRGLVTQDKLAEPDAYKAEPSTPKLAIELLSQHITNALATLQGDKEFPNSLDHAMAVAHLQAYQKAHGLIIKA